MLVASLEHAFNRACEWLDRQLTEAATGFSHYEAGDYLIDSATEPTSAADDPAEATSPPTSAGSPNLAQALDFIYPAFLDVTTTHVVRRDTVGLGLGCDECREYFADRDAFREHQWTEISSRVQCAAAARQLADKRIADQLYTAGFHNQ